MNSYTVYSLLYWPSKIKDNFQTRKLLNSVMLRMHDILIRLSKQLGNEATLKEAEEITLADTINKINMPFIDHLFLLDPELLNLTDSESQTLGLNNEVSELVSHAWTMSSMIYANKKIDIPKLVNEDKLLNICKSLAVLQNDWRFTVYYHLIKTERKKEF